MTRALRIGVTGIRTVSGLRETAPAPLVASLDAVLARGVEVLARACRSTGERAVLRCLSPLAEGADQLFARAALALREPAAGQGVRVALEVPVPFAQGTYLDYFERGRPDDPVGGFAALVAAAGHGVFELDGGVRDAEVTVASYEAVGQLVVGNADLMVAVWDPALPPRGRGGTRDTVAHALAHGVPVWCIDPAGALADRFFEPCHSDDGGADDGETEARLAQCLARLLAADGPGPACAAREQGLAQAADLLAAMGWSLAQGRWRGRDALRAIPLPAGALATRLPHHHGQVLALMAAWGDPAEAEVARIDPGAPLASRLLGAAFLAAVRRFVLA